MKFSDKFDKRLMAIASANPELALQSVFKLPHSQTAFRISASHADGGRKLSGDDYAAMVLAMTEKQFGLVPESLDVLGVSGNSKIITGIIEANVAVREYKEDEINGKYRSVAANVFIDNEDSIWKVVESNGTKQLVQSVNEDFTQLIAARIARKASQVVAAAYPGQVPTSGDYVMYYNGETQTVNYGYALVAQDIVVVDRKLNSEVSIAPANVIEIVVGTCLDGNHNVVNYLKEQNKIMADDIVPSRGNIYANYLAYMKNLFQGTDYYNKLEELIGKRRHSAMQITPVTTNKLVVEKV